MDMYQGVITRGRGIRLFDREFPANMELRHKGAMLTTILDMLLVIENLISNHLMYTLSDFLKLVEYKLF
jgi:hypothetical protein